MEKFLVLLAVLISGFLIVYGVVQASSTCQNTNPYSGKDTLLINGRMYVATKPAAYENP